MTDRDSLETLHKIAPFLLLIDISLAGGLWYFRGHIFPESLLWLAAPLAVALMLGALAGYFVLQSMTNKTR